MHDRAVDRAAPHAAPVPLAVRDWLLVALSFAAGIRALHVPGISTTAFTATVISLASGIATWSLPTPAVRRLTGALVSMAAGAFLGGWMLCHAHHYAPVVPVIVTAVVISVASVVLKPAGQPGQVAAGQSPGPSDAGSPTTLTVVLSPRR
jgi:uncharacterized membrane protein YoaK (UPF0700 family)